MAARILVVEADPIERQLLAAILHHRGHHVCSASTVDEGRAQLAREPADLVLVDASLPRGGGRTLLRAIRRDPVTCGVPVIAIADHDDASVRRARAAFDGRVRRPVEISAFVQVVERLLRERPGELAREAET